MITLRATMMEATAAIHRVNGCVGEFSVGVCAVKGEGVESEVFSGWGVWLV